MRCSVVLALADSQWCWEIELAAGATVAQALAAARQRATDREEFAATAFAAWESAPVGIFGRSCERTQPLAEGDRVEIYRPLAADPKESRRARARRR